MKLIVFLLQNEVSISSYFIYETKLKKKAYLTHIRECEFETIYIKNGHDINIKCVKNVGDYLIFTALVQTDYLQLNSLAFENIQNLCTCMHYNLHTANRCVLLISTADIFTN